MGGRPDYGLALYLAVVLAFAAPTPGGRRALARVPIYLDPGVHLDLGVQRRLASTNP
jgi:hypothetical protein